MHIDIGALLLYLRMVFDFIATFGKPALETTKTAMDTYKGGMELLQKGEVKPTESQFDYAAERGFATADLLRSMAMIAFVEYLLWLTRSIFAFLILRQWLQFVSRDRKKGA